MIAFYAPLKPPTHPVPSGDREIARNLMALLPGAALASELRLFDKAGDAALQKDLKARAAAEVTRLLDALKPAPPSAWVTYHNYYKAPDLIGPAVSAALGIPYILIEATRARKRLTGPWADFAHHAERATDAADLVFYFTAHDKTALVAHKPEGQRLVHLPPFLPMSDLPPRTRVDEDAPMLTVGMMRPGDKLASYRLIADTLTLLQGNWSLTIVGDGPARPEVEALMAPFGNRVRFTGALARDALADAYTSARLLFWPGVNEAFGMVYLEAQAHGLPVVAQDRPGVRDVLAQPDQPSPKDGAEGLRRKIDDVTNALPDTAMIRSYIRDRHLAPAAKNTILSAIEQAQG